MYPEDRVLVGVINRKRDFEKAQREHWYRVPTSKVPDGIHAEYLAFYLSKRLSQSVLEQSAGGIYYYARRTGTELARRRDLLPEESSHKRADETYYKVQFGDLRPKTPPILNPSKRAVAFIYTTWDRFEQAEIINDLYSDADEFVDRVFHALGPTKQHAKRVWQAARQSDDGGAQIRVECKKGTVIASTMPGDEHIILLPTRGTADDVKTTADTIKAAIKRHGGLLMIAAPLEG